MSIFDFLSGQFIDVIHWTDDSRDTMVWRFERYGHEIKYGAKLTVREGQAAVFVHEGQLADVFTPGLYLLETNNMPVMTTLQHWDHGFRSPFKSEIYFVSTRRFTDLRWGTKNPVILRDPEFGPTRVRAFGTYAMKVADPARFLREIVGTDGAFTADEISFQLRNVIVQEVSRAIASSNIPVLDMAANTDDLGRLVAAEIAVTMAEYGVAIPELYIENISLPAAVEAALDKRTSMGVVGDLGRYTQFQAAEALAREGGAAGDAMGTGLGAGIGLEMARQMGQSGPWGPRPAAAPPPPPPPPVEHVWHIAEGGRTHGPYSRARMGRMVSEGTLSRDSYVWTQGQDGWMRAEDVAELAQLFTVMPPPPPDA
ncbi:membrane protease subunit (stomatin/prohibitin family) [Palleronia aestuarii]|uniref:Membrane protease subunit (Stomatin/prohibitin family) n=1 Tax=Palleronia aestuarii TaxID=568105 RepID=A0A2W7NBH6_9RHOB|nr:SPFH domain-containing protein [Palleronia aestuarii]PZX17775.1 membrane protease subunit (stomatin/prohibitin family) [Palleronia aestuarii]